MKIDIKVPEVGESVREALLVEWFRGEGEPVTKDEPIFVIETDKVTLEVPAEADGVLSIQVPAGKTIDIGSVVGTIDTEGAPETVQEPEKREKEEEFAASATEALDAAPSTPEPSEPPLSEKPSEAAKTPETPPLLAPSVRRFVAAKGLDISKITGSGPGGRITKGDVLLHMESGAPEKARTEPSVSTPSEPKQAESSKPETTVVSEEEKVTRKPMSPIRRRIAQRLLEAKHSTAMLTTFNEIDMSRMQAIRHRFKDSFLDRYGVRLGMMSFFIKASIEALKEFPELNAFVVDDKEIEYHDFYHIGIAIGAERGLVVPVVRHANRLSFSELERAILDHVKKIKENRLELSDLEGGTFTITNGGIYGSLLSTPILNTPQSGILGMHKIEDRPVVIDGNIEIRPMMYVALSYDHRIVDGRQAVTFLRRIKECIEEPERMIIEV